jgi:hypothetical protein
MEMALAYDQGSAVIPVTEVYERVGFGQRDELSRILRGQGQLIKGRAGYEWNAAKARELDAQTARDLDPWNREDHEVSGKPSSPRAQGH